MVKAFMAATMLAAPISQQAVPVAAYTNIINSYIDAGKTGVVRQYDLSDKSGFANYGRFKYFGYDPNGDHWINKGNGVYHFTHEINVSNIASRFVKDDVQQAIIDTDLQKPVFSLESFPFSPLNFMTGQTGDPDFNGAEIAMTNMSFAVSLKNAPTNTYFLHDAHAKVSHGEFANPWEYTAPWVNLFGLDASGPDQTYTAANGKLNYNMAPQFEWKNFLALTLEGDLTMTPVGSSAPFDFQANNVKMGNAYSPIIDLWDTTPYAPSAPIGGGKKTLQAGETWTITDYQLSAFQYLNTNAFSIDWTYPNDAAKPASYTDLKVVARHPGLWEFSGDQSVVSLTYNDRNHTFTVTNNSQEPISIDNFATSTFQS